MTQQISQEELQELIQEELVNVLTEEQLEEFMAGVSALAKKAGQAALQKGSQVASKAGKAALEKGTALAKQGLEKAGNMAKDVAANAGNTYKSAELNKQIQVLAKKREAVNIKMKQLQQAMMAINADLQMKQDELAGLSAEE